MNWLLLPELEAAPAETNPFLRRFEFRLLDAQFRGLRADARGARAGLASSYDRTGENRDYSYYDDPPGLIQDTIRSALADELLFGKLANGGSVTVDVKDGKVVLEFAEEAVVA